MIIKQSQINSLILSQTPETNIFSFFYSYYILQMGLISVFKTSSSILVLIWKQKKEIKKTEKLKD